MFLVFAAGCTGSDPKPGPELVSELILAPPACADPGARESAGPWERVELGADWVFAPDYRSPTWDLRFGARGLVVADLDGDGHLDLVVPQVHEKTRLLLGDGAGGFAEAPLPEVPELTGPTGGSAGDLDGDGDLDLFLYGQGRLPGLTMPPGTAVVLENDGAAGFAAAVHGEWDDPELGGCGGSASFGDYDLDGDLDVYFGQLGRTLPSGDSYFCGGHLLRNDGGTLVDASDELPADARAIRVLASGFLPFDDDPEPELYLVADAIMEHEGIVAGSDLLLDRAGGWQVATGTGLDVIAAGMGLAAGDPNGDGRVDVMVPGVDELLVLMSLGAADAWVESSGATGISPGQGQHSGWGGEWQDLDLDGRLDLTLGFGTFADPSSREPDEIWRGTGAGYERVGAAWGFADDFPTRGFVVADVNEDGWPDVVKRELGGVVVLYLSRCGDAHWIELTLADDARPNGFGVGATVTVVSGGERQLRYVTAGSTSYQIGGPPVVEFGLGDRDSVDDVEVRWPDGEVGHSGPLDVDRKLRLRR